MLVVCCCRFHSHHSSMTVSLSELNVWPSKLCVLDKLQACVCKQRNHSCRLLHTNVRRPFLNKNDAKLLCSYFYHSLVSLKLHINSKWRSDSVMCLILLILSHWKCHENIYPFLKGRKCKRLLGRDMKVVSLGQVYFNKTHFFTSSNSLEILEERL